MKSLLTNSHGSSTAISDCLRGPLELEISGLYWIDAWMDALRLSAPKDRGLHLLITFGWVCYGHIMS